HRGGAPTLRSIAAPRSRRSGPEAGRALLDRAHRAPLDRPVDRTDEGDKLMPGRLAFVPPRYGTEIVGGSEAVMREAAHGLARRGWDVEVLTTCARDHYTWRNQFEPGKA